MRPLDRRIAEMAARRDALPSPGRERRFRRASGAAWRERWEKADADERQGIPLAATLDP